MEGNDKLCLNTVLNHVSTSLVECILDVSNHNVVPLQFQGRQLDKVVKLTLTFERNQNDKFWTILRFFPNIKWLNIKTGTSLDNEQRVALPQSQLLSVTHLKGFWEREITFPEEWYRQVEMVDLKETGGGLGWKMNQDERAITVRLISLLENVEDFAWVTCEMDVEMAKVISTHCVRLKYLRFTWSYVLRPVGELVAILDVLLSGGN
ncbi:hypothetical protein HDU76_013824 [Blyttiomyces sp. JEL0837]|nr:hypothetical protein HDU76_013824 [Blyttiomyces sp. JEL0837]